MFQMELNFISMVHEKERVCQDPVDIKPVR